MHKSAYDDSFIVPVSLEYSRKKTNYLENNISKLNEFI